MPKVSIGVPVYNGEDMISECLECLCRQSFQDIEIIISDNASTDNTQQIIEQWAARDNRIRYIRQPQNIGLMGNFKAVLEASHSPYFIFRCHDDLSSLDYVEKLINGIISAADLHLAVASVLVQEKGKTNEYVGVPSITSNNEILKIQNLLFGAHCSWFCGLWVTKILKQYLNQVWSTYSSPRGPDYLTIYPVILDQKVALVPETFFIQRITPKPGSKRKTKLSLREMTNLRNEFLTVSFEFLRERKFLGVKKIALYILTWLYAGKRIYRFSKVVRYAITARW